MAEETMSQNFIHTFIDEDLAPGGQFEGIGVAVDAEMHAAVQALEYFRGMACAAQGAVQVVAVRTDIQAIKALIEKNGKMMEFHSVTSYKNTRLSGTRQMIKPTNAKILTNDSEFERIFAYCVSCNYKWQSLTSM